MKSNHLTKVRMSIEEIQENVENLNFSEPGPSNAATQSRAEKKARQALQGHGLKKVPGVTRVVLRRSRNVMLVASNPEVHTAPGSGIHIVSCCQNEVKKDY